MMQLPLFPLNSVLFPGMPLRLHIFESRYVEMINECVEQQSPFGVVLIAEGREALGELARPHTVGTTAYITEVKHVAFGQMNILILDQERFKIHDLDFQSRSFLIGDVELLPMQDLNTYTAQLNAAKLRPLIERYLQTLSKVGQIEFDAKQIPFDDTRIFHCQTQPPQNRHTNKNSAKPNEIHRKKPSNYLITKNR
jgi:hypothetical protein